MPELVRVRRGNVLPNILARTHVLKAATIWLISAPIVVEPGVGKPATVTSAASGQAVSSDALEVVTTATSAGEVTTSTAAEVTSDPGPGDVESC